MPRVEWQIEAIDSQLEAGTVGPRKRKTLKEWIGSLSLFQFKINPKNIFSLI